MPTVQSLFQMVNGAPVKVPISGGEGSLPDIVQRVEELENKFSEDGKLLAGLVPLTQLVDGKTIGVNSNGKLFNYYPAPSARIYVTSSNSSWAPPARGLYRIILVGGGGGGGHGGRNDPDEGGQGGGEGGITSYSHPEKSIYVQALGGGGGGGGAGSASLDVSGGGGGGGAGQVVYGYVWLETTDRVSITIGAGGFGGWAINTGNLMGTNGGGALGGRGAYAAYMPGQGGGSYSGGPGGNGSMYDSGTPAPGSGGNGGSNGTGYGGGGGGGAGDVSANSDVAYLPGRGADNGAGGGVSDRSMGGTGGAGGQGVVIFEYFNG